jgi:hypothetical protein
LNVRLPISHPNAGRHTAVNATRSELDNIKRLFHETSVMNEIGDERSTAYSQIAASSNFWSGRAAGHSLLFIEPFSRLRLYGRHLREQRPSSPSHNGDCCQLQRSLCLFFLLFLLLRRFLRALHVAAAGAGVIAFSHIRRPYYRRFQKGESEVKSVNLVYCCSTPTLFSW